MAKIVYAKNDKKPLHYYITFASLYLVSVGIIILGKGIDWLLVYLRATLFKMPYLSYGSDISNFLLQLGLTLFIVTILTHLIKFLFANNPYNKGRILKRIKQYIMARKIQQAMIDNRLFNPRHGREGIEVGDVQPSLSNPMFIDIELVGNTLNDLEKSGPLLNATLKGVFKNFVVNQISHDVTGRWFRIYLWNSSKSNRLKPLQLDELITEKDYQYKLTKQVVWDISKNPHGLIAGKTGSGKTYALYGLILQMLQHSNNVYIADPKKADLSSLSDIFPEGHVSSNADDIEIMIENAVSLMHERQEKIIELSRKLNLFDADFTDIPEMKPIFILIDEISALMSSFDEPKKAKNFNKHLKQLIMKGRSAGVNIILLTQQPNAQTVPTDIRDQLGLRILLGDNSLQTKQMVFGEGYTYPQIETAKGTGLFFINGTVQSPSLMETSDLSNLGNNLLPIFKIAQQIQYKER